MDVYVFANDNLAVMSYGNRAIEKIEKSAGKIWDAKNIDVLRSLLSEMFLTNVGRNIKYIHRNQLKSPVSAAVLNAGHSELFFKFFKKNNPNNKDYSWVEEYFFKIASKKYCHGIITGNELVSATDAPDMPYMRESVQKIGINTLKEYRGRGYARAACISLIDELLSRNICPLWSTGENNTPSDRLAKSIGFEKLADVLTISIPE
jgi:RimJ/RimL family protein N-acetyltransferase